MRRENGTGPYKKAILILAVFSFLGVCIFLTQKREVSSMQAEGIERREPGEGEESYTWNYRIGEGEKQKLDVTVGERRLTETESMELLEQSREEWEKEWLADNPSPEEVSGDLWLPDTMADGLVEVAYTFSDYSVFNSFGEINEEALTEKGTPITLTASFTCEEIGLTSEKAFTAVKRQLSGKQAQEEQIREAVRKEEMRTRSQERFLLPESVNGETVSWEAEVPKTGLYFPLLGGVAVLLLVFRKKDQEHKAKKKRREELQAGYPQMVDQMALLLGGGMSIRGAWERMVAVYQQMRKGGMKQKQIWLEEMRITWREICDGRGERECYERFGARTGLACYRRFSSILAQNLTRGSADIRRILEEEAKDAAEERIHRVRRLGEEAGSKLLGPMLLMFVIVLVAVMVPALVSFSL